MPLHGWAIFFCPSHPFYILFPPTSFESFIFWAEPAPAPAALGSIALHEGRHGRKTTLRDGLKGGAGSKVTEGQTCLGTTCVHVCKTLVVWGCGGGCLRRFDWPVAVGSCGVVVLRVITNKGNSNEMLFSCMDDVMQESHLRTNSFFIALFCRFVVRNKSFSPPHQHRHYHHTRCSSTDSVSSIIELHHACWVFTRFAHGT